MGTAESKADHLSLPATVLAALRRAVSHQAGSLAAIHVLQAAGFETGGRVFDDFEARLGDAPDELPTDTFWDEFGHYVEERGWGTIEHDSVHPGVGVFRSENWVEASEMQEDEPTCSFSSGLLSGFLTRLASGPVAVLQVECRSRGDDCCTFAFGSEAAMHDLYGFLLEDADFDLALARL